MHRLTPESAVGLLFVLSTKVRHSSEVGEFLVEDINGAVAAYETGSAVRRLISSLNGR